MLAVYESLALAQTAQIWQSIKKSQVARTRAKAKRLDTEQCQDGWTGSGAEVETLAEKNTSKDVALPSYRLTLWCNQCVKPTYVKKLFLLYKWKKVKQKARAGLWEITNGINGI